MKKQIFFTNWQFLTGAHNFKQLPVYRNPEFAFAGASNVGKSTLVNILLEQKLAITSRTPGRTQQINFFISSNFDNPQSPVIVDMPGYGFAKASKKAIGNWQELAINYLTNRKNLQRVFLLIDPQKGLKTADLEVCNILAAVAMPFQILLTKTERHSEAEITEATSKINEQLKNNAAWFNKIIVTSSLRNIGIDDIRQEIITILNNLFHKSS